MRETRLKWSTFLIMACRSMLLQASWNFERLQNLGFYYILTPGLQKIHGPVLPAEISTRHMGYFNTHPYLAPLVAGTILRLENRLNAGEESPVGTETYKQMVMAPFAAMGDALFWGGARPFAALIALFFASQGSLWAPVVFLVLFNLPHLSFRFGGLLLGYYQELRAIDTVQRMRLPDLAIRLKEMTVILLGVLCAYLAYKGCDHQEIPAYWGFVLLPVIFLYAFLSRKGFSTLFLVLLTTFSLLLLGVLF